MTDAPRMIATPVEPKPSLDPPRLPLRPVA